LHQTVPPGPIIGYQEPFLFLAIFHGVNFKTTPGCQESPVSGTPGRGFLTVFLKLQAIAAAFKETIKQKTLCESFIYCANTFDSCITNFTNFIISDPLPSVPYSGESFLKL